jgi:2-oxo-4-hydroxy-4-carboxy-5-ureidoimidazoline decarboxylase
MAVQLSLAALNAMPPEDAKTTLAGIFERSPWVAEAILDQRPFADAAALHAAMVAAVEVAPQERKLALLSAHPELAGAEARVKLITPESVAEQGSAGLDALSDVEQAAFDRMNAEYRERFGFPFIVAVRNHSRASILATFRARLDNDRETEITQALAQVYEITRLRLQDLTGETIGKDA